MCGGVVRCCHCLSQWCLPQDGMGPEFSIPGWKQASWAPTSRCSHLMLRLAPLHSRAIVQPWSQRLIISTQVLQCSCSPMLWSRQGALPPGHCDQLRTSLVVISITLSASFMCPTLQGLDSMSSNIHRANLTS